MKIGAGSAVSIEVERSHLSKYHHMMVMMMMTMMTMLMMQMTMMTMMIKIPCQLTLCSTAGIPLGGSSGQSRGFGKPFLGIILRWVKIIFRENLSTILSHLDFPLSGRCRSHRDNSDHWLSWTAWSSLYVPVSMIMTLILINDHVDNHGSNFDH